VKAVGHQEGAFARVELVCGLESGREVAIAGTIGRERLNLHQQRWHQVEGNAHAREFAQQRHHAPVILGCVQPHPRQHVLARREILVVRLVHVPQDGESSHRG
jgi:hypothetical protein